MHSYCREEWISIEKMVRIRWERLVDLVLVLSDVLFFSDVDVLPYIQYILCSRRFSQRLGSLFCWGRIVITIPNYYYSTYRYYLHIHPPLCWKYEIYSHTSIYISANVQLNETMAPWYLGLIYVTPWAFFFGLVFLRGQG